MAAKRGGGKAALELQEAFCISDDDGETVTELDEALRRLKALSPRQWKPWPRGSGSARD